MPSPITSPQNPRVKQVVRLRDRRHRDQEGLLLVEGADELTLALAGGARPQTIYFCPALATHPSDLIAAAMDTGAEAIEVSAAVFQKMAYRENPGGILAVLPAIRHGLADLPPSERPLYLIAEAVEKPGNLGALLRSADAAGVTGVIVCDPATDLGNPNVVRSSRGTLFTVPLAEASTAETLAWLRQRNVTLVAATPQATLLYTQADLGGPTAIAVGTEDQGLTPAWLTQAHFTVRIPMQGRVNSLNVATAATLLLYEALRQRT
ncbi:MAG: RNA methyltransferase [Anaerolineales bacterium]